ncbi:MAG: ABC transporter ATP-binding protein [Xanthomonadales bacterium]|nr:ABC transporter ATP-binding protein [Xanthomonadales bacterium]
MLSVRDLSVFIGDQAVVDRVSFDLYAGEVLALVGESGCGKTKTAEAIMGLLAGDAKNRRTGSIRLGEQELMSMSEAEMRRIRGREISMVFQEPMTALDPVFSNGEQLAQQFRRHRGQSRRQARDSAAEMLTHVGIQDPERIMRSYPHQLSGGLRQRLIVAMAMACRPQVLIADEPTTALDVTTQAQVLGQMTKLGREIGTAILLITHDLGVVAQYGDRALIMRRGKLLENQPVKDLFAKPENPYTGSLIAAARELST